MTIRRIQSLWSGFEKLMKGTSIALNAPSGGDELIERSPRVLSELLAELTDFSRRVLVHGLDGRLVNVACLKSQSKSELLLLLDEPAVLMSNAPLHLNITAFTSRGMVLLTIKVLWIKSAVEYVISIPIEILRMQSRSQYRVSTPVWSPYKATLTIPGAAKNLPLHDISEAGLGLLIYATLLTEGTTMISDCILNIDGQTLPLPQLEIIHRSARGTNIEFIGAQFHGMTSGHTRHLRLWIDVVQTSFSRKLDLVINN